MTRRDIKVAAIGYLIGSLLTAVLWYYGSGLSALLGW
jgi:hypothetical protein